MKVMRSSPFSELHHQDPIKSSSILSGKSLALCTVYGVHDKARFSMTSEFLREEVLERWDIIISAFWLNPTEMQSYKTISSKLQESLSDTELVQFSRIVLLNHDDPVVSYLQGLEIISNGGFKELSANELSEKFKFTIKRAYLLRSQKLNEEGRSRH